MQSLSLSTSDSKVLAQVFDPESGPAAAEVVVDPYLAPDRHIADTALLIGLKAQEKTAIRCIESFERSQDKTQQTRRVAYSNALAILNQIIAKHPTYASARNNRAQIRRWRFGDRNLICQTRNFASGPDRKEAASAASAAVDDLKQAIALTAPSRPQDAVSPAQGQLLGQAYTQLGALYHAAAKDLSVSAECEILVDGLSNWTKDIFEEEASRLFYLGGLYGNEVAKALAVHTNPHAKLCGSIVKEAMQKELSQVSA